MKILVIRLSSMGDIVVTSPVVRWLKTQLKAEVHFLTKPNFIEIIQFNPNIDQIWSYNKSEDFQKKLKEQDFDLIVDLHKSKASTWISLQLGKKTIRYNKLNFQKFLLTHLKINTLPKIHLVDRYAKALSKIGVLNDGKGLDFYIDHNAKLPENIPNSYEVLVLGAAHATKRIPLELARNIILHSSKNIVLLGGNDVVEIGNKLSVEFPQIINMIGKTNLHTSARILYSAIKVYTGDTGLMHISAALEKDITIYWGSTAPIIGMFPYLPLGSEAQIINKEVELWCRPCTKIGYSYCPLGHFNCMNLQQI